MLGATCFMISKIHLIKLNVTFILGNILLFLGKTAENGLFLGFFYHRPALVLSRCTW